MKEKLIILLGLKGKEDDEMIMGILDELIDYSTEYVLSFTAQDTLIKRLEVVVVEMVREFFTKEIAPQIKKLEQGEISITYEISTLEEKLNSHKVILRYHTI